MSASTFSPGFRWAVRSKWAGRRESLENPRQAPSGRQDHAFRRAQRDLSPHCPRTAKSQRYPVGLNRRRRSKGICTFVMRGIETLKGPGARDSEDRPAFIVKRRRAPPAARPPGARSAQTPAPIKTLGSGPAGGPRPPQDRRPPFCRPATPPRGPHDSAHGQAPLGHRPDRQSGGRRKRSPGGPPPP